MLKTMKTLFTCFISAKNYWQGTVNEEYSLIWMRQIGP